jgi:hypothetical protein
VHHHVRAAVESDVDGQLGLRERVGRATAVARDFWQAPAVERGVLLVAGDLDETEVVEACTAAFSTISRATFARVAGSVRRARACSALPSNTQDGKRMSMPVLAAV